MSSVPESGPDATCLYPYHTLPPTFDSNPLKPNGKPRYFPRMEMEFNGDVEVYIAVRVTHLSDDDANEKRYDDCRAVELYYGFNLKENPYATFRTIARAVAKHFAIPADVHVVVVLQEDRSNGVVTPQFYSPQVVEDALEAHQLIDGKLQPLDPLVWGRDPVD